MLVLGEVRWALHLLGDGSIIEWGPLGPEMRVRPRRRWSSEVAIRSRDGTYRATFRLPFTSSSRIEREMARRREAASLTADRLALIQTGAWWLSPHALSEAGPSRTVSLVETAYLGGWDGRVKPYKKGRLGILDFDRDGVSLRGFRRWLRIPWSSVADIQIGDDVVWSSALTLRLTSGDEVRFANAALGATEVASALRPVIRHLSRGPAPQTEGSDGHALLHGKSDTA